MSYRDESAGSRPMVQGNWSCAGCGATITELPFQPDGSRPVHCRDCHKSRSPRRDDRGGGSRDFAPRPMVQGNWECAGCSVAITELPFQPDGSRPIYCRDCHRSSRG